MSKIRQKSWLSGNGSVLCAVILYKVLLNFEPGNKILLCTIQMKAIEQYFPVVLFILLFPNTCYPSGTEEEI